VAHIGVLAALDSQDIPIDMIAGTSMGALVGAVYSLWHDVDRMKNLAKDLGPKRLSFMADPALSKSGLIRGHKIKELLKSLMGDTRFQDLDIPFACPAVDITNGCEVVIKDGLLWEGVRASCSIPVILTPTKLNGRYLVDGGLVSPVPVRVLEKMGADIIIAVNVIPNPGQRKFQVPDISINIPKEPNIFEVAMQTINIVSSQRLKTSLSRADIVIEPRVAHIGPGEFNRIDECIYNGEQAAREAVPMIKRLIAVGHSKSESPENINRFSKKVESKTWN
jgi:NTE family protein